MTARPRPAWLDAAIASALCMLAIEISFLPVFLTHLPADQRLGPYYELIRRHDLPVLPAFLAVMAVALLMSARSRLAISAADLCARRPWSLAALALVVYSLGAVFVYHQHPLSMDEYAPWFQSRVFAAGEMHGSVPGYLMDAVIPARFQGHFFATNRDTGAIAAAYWPAFALVQAPFAALGLNWLVNPILSAGALLVLDSLARKIGFDDRARGLVLLSSIAAAAVAVNAMGMYAMPLLMFCNLVFTRLVMARSATALASAGLVGSVCLVALNPVPHALYAAPWLLWVARRAGGGPRAVAWLAAGYLPLGMGLGLGWQLALRHIAGSGPSDTGHGLDRYLGAFSLPGADILVARLFALAKLDLWAVPGMLALAVAGMFVWKAPVARCFAASALLTWIGYLFVPFTQGHGWGYRYFQQAWPVLPILAVAAFTTAAASEALRRRTAGFLAVASLGSLVVLVPLRMVQVENFVAEHLRQLPPGAAVPGRQVVFVRTTCGYYTEDLVQNDPFLRGNELRFVSMGEVRNREIAAQFVGAPVVTGRTECAERWAAGAPGRDGGHGGGLPPPASLSNN